MVWKELFFVVFLLFFCCFFVVFFVEGDFVVVSLMMLFVDGYRLRLKENKPFSLPYGLLMPSSREEVGKRSNVLSRRSRLTV